MRLRANYSFSIDFDPSIYIFWLLAPSVPYKMFKKEFNDSDSEVSKYFDIGDDRSLTLKREYRDDE